MTGILLIDKPEGLTSFGALIRVKKIIGQKKCGHTGTLDPLATGVLTVMLGNATRFCELLPDHDKEYIASFRLGTVTDTFDITGKVLKISEVNSTAADVRAALEEFKGKIKQTPPMFSAVSVNGKRLYELARKGEEIEREERDAEIFELEMLDCDEGKGEYTVRVACSGGTYVRTLTDDLGKKLGCGAVLTALRRTRANGFSVENALTLDELKAAVEAGELGNHILSVESALESYPKVVVSSAQAVRFANGGELLVERLRGAKKDGIYRVFDPQMKFLGLGENDGGENLLVKRVFKAENT